MCWDGLVDMWHELRYRIHSPTPHQTQLFQIQGQVLHSQQTTKQLSRYLSQQLEYDVAIVFHESERPNGTQGLRVRHFLSSYIHN